MAVTRLSSKSSLDWPRLTVSLSRTSKWSSSCIGGVLLVRRLICPAGAALGGGGLLSPGRRLVGGGAVRGEPGGKDRAEVTAGGRCVGCEVARVGVVQGVQPAYKPPAWAQKAPAA